MPGKIVYTILDFPFRQVDVVGSHFPWQLARHEAAAIATVLNQHKFRWYRGALEFCRNVDNYILTCDAGCHEDHEQKD